MRNLCENGIEIQVTQEGERIGPSYMKLVKRFVHLLAKVGSNIKKNNNNNDNNDDNNNSNSNNNNDDDDGNDNNNNNDNDNNSNDNNNNNNNDKQPPEENYRQSVFPGTANILR